MRKTQILRGRTSFDRVFRRGRRIEGSLFRLHVDLHASRAPALRVACAVPARAMPAVRRNRVRRLMREAVRAELPGLQERLSGARAAMDGVFVYRPRERTDPRRLSLGDVRGDVGRIVALLRERL